MQIYVDLDGTICGKSEWNGLLDNSLSLLRGEILFNPELYFSNWILLTSRPIIDFLLIKVICWFRKLEPKQILTCEQFFWTRVCIKKKVNFLIQKAKLDPLELIYYIDSDQEILDLFSDLKHIKNLIALRPDSEMFEQIFYKRV